MSCTVHLRQLKLDLFLSAPSSEETHWVQCLGHKCLAVVDKNGKWECFATGKELIDFIKLPADEVKPTNSSKPQT
jgi:hypothetical protein